MDDSLSTELNVEPPISSNLLPSASVQTRLLNISSQSRQRMPTSVSVSKISDDIAEDEEEQDSFSKYFVPWTTLENCSEDATTLRQRLAYRLRLKWILLVYCCFCVGFLSSGLGPLWPARLSMPSIFDFPSESDLALDALRLKRT